MEDITIFRLCGEDVITILREQGLLSKLDDSEIKEIIYRVADKLAIPWDEYVLAALMEVRKELYFT